MSMPPSGISSLAERLTDPTDRETYARLISYVHSLPPGDEFRRLVDLLGLVSLVGQRLPDAAAELLAEMRRETKAAADYQRKGDERLGSLPSEIAAGVDAKEVAEEMAEAFRQQIAATGLRDTAALLRASSKDITALAGEISTSLRPVTREYQNVSAAVSAEVIRLTEASRELQNQYVTTRLVLSQLVEHEKSSGWFMNAVMMLVLFLLGGICGGVTEKRQTTEALLNVQTQVERIQTPTPFPTVAPRAIAKKR